MHRIRDEVRLRRPRSNGIGIQRHVPPFPEVPVDGEHVRRRGRDLSPEEEREDQHDRDGSADDSVRRAEIAPRDAAKQGPRGSSVPGPASVRKAVGPAEPVHETVGSTDAVGQAVRATDPVDETVRSSERAVHVAAAPTRTLLGSAGG